MAFEEYLAWSVLDNTGMAWATAIGAFIATWIVVWIFKKVILSGLKNIAKKTESKYDDIVVSFIDKIKTPFYFVVALYVGSSFLVLPEMIATVIYFAVVVGVVYYAVKGLQSIVSLAKDFIVEQRKKEGESDVALLNIIESAINLVLWVLAALLILGNLGFDITALVAGLGIGGLAVAIAAQAVLKDVLAAFTIFFDKPFKVGDFIVVGGDSGTIKSIGIKSTRIQTLQGQELVISNQELTSSRVNNYKRMSKRRVPFNFGVLYETPVSKVRRIPKMVKEIIDSIDKCKADRVHFKSFGDSSLDFEVVYYIDSSDYTVYMDAQQKINLMIAERFEKEKIEFAYPTRTVYLKE